MNKNIIKFIAASLMVTSFTSCMKEFDVEKNYVSQEELEDAPKAFSSLVDAITSNLSGEYTYSGASQYANDWGYPSILIQNDIMGQDIVPVDCTGMNGFQHGILVVLLLVLTMQCAKCLGHTTTCGLRTAIS